MRPIIYAHPEHVEATQHAMPGYDVRPSTHVPAADENDEPVRAVGWTKDDGTDREIHIFFEHGEGNYVIGFNEDFFSRAEISEFLKAHNMNLAPRVSWLRRVLRAIVG